MLVPYVPCGQRRCSPHGAGIYNQYSLLSRVVAHGFLYPQLIPCWLFLCPAVQKAQCPYYACMHLRNPMILAKKSKPELFSVLVWLSKFRSEARVAQFVCTICTTSTAYSVELWPTAFCTRTSPQPVEKAAGAGKSGCIYKNRTYLVYSVLKIS